MPASTAKLSKILSDKKIALAHDYLRDYGGAERVLEELHNLFPDSPVYVSFFDQEKLGIHTKRFSGWDIRESWLTRIPFYKTLFSPLRILAPSFFRSFDMSEYDLVISSSNAYYAKALQVPNGVHVCYCHTPPRSLWGYNTMTDWKKHPVTRSIGTLINHYLRIKDVPISRAVDHLIANSQETQSRITKFYKRDSTVIYPPVKTAAGAAVAGKKSQQELSESYFLYVSRLSYAKHPELAVKVCTALNLPLKVAGTGAILTDLQEMAGPTVEFLGSVTDQELHDLYVDARALIYPVEDEDFGMVPVEAMSYGVPVITHASGGPLESVVDGTTGVHFSELTEAGLSTAFQQFSADESSFDRKTISTHAQQYSVDVFKREMQKFVAGVVR